jgi:hypothetical protein
MPKAYFVVRAVVEAPLRQKFDHWYSTDHLPSAMAAFKAEKAWRLWSTVEAGVHYAVYQFADMRRLEAGVNPQSLQPLIADFDKTWPAGVTRSRDILAMVEERSAG